MQVGMAVSSGARMTIDQDGTPQPCSTVLAGCGGLVLLFAATLAPPGIQAADIAPPSHAPGERFVLRMADERFGDCVAEPDSGYRFMFRCDASQPRTEDLRPYLRPPVRVGESWTHYFRELIGGAPMSVHVDVTERERITVPAGTYEAYRLEIDERRVGANDGAKQRCWYAPDIQFPVKCEGSIGVSFELLEHRE